MTRSTENGTLRILLLEDTAADAELCKRELERAGLQFTMHRADTRAGFEAALDQFSPDLILADFTLPDGFDGLAALELVRHRLPEVPFVFVSGTIGEERAVEAMKQGAADYVLKDRMARLGGAVLAVLERSRLEREARETGKRLRESEERFRATFDQAAVGMALRAVDPRNPRWLRVNQKLCDILGYTREELLRLTSVDITPPEDRNLAIDYNKQLLQGEITHYSREQRYVRKDGQVIWANVSLSAVQGPDGRLTHVVSAIQDITERKRLERVRAVMGSVNSVIIRARDQQQLFDEACRIAVEQGKLKMAWIGLLDRVTERVRPAAWANIGEEFLRRLQFSAREDEPGGKRTVGQALRTGKPVWENDIAASPSTGPVRQYAIEHGIRSMIALPLLVEGRVEGVFSLYAEESLYFTEEEVRLLEEMASNVSFALENLDRQQKLARLSRTRAVSSTINGVIVRVRGRQELFEEACRIAVEDGHFPFAWIGVLDSASQDVTPIAWAGESAEGLTRVTSSARADVPQGQGAVGQAIRERRAVFNNDIATRGFGGPRLKEIQRLGFRSQITLPLLEGGMAIGALTMYAKEPGFFDEEELRLLNELTGNISFALQSIAKQETLEYLSYYDTLTGLPNRQLFVDRLGQQMRSRSGEAPMVALILLDLDRFRNVNESLGHHGGDELLKTISNRLEHALRGKDYLARIGSNAFGAIVRGVREAVGIIKVLEDDFFSCVNQPFVVSGGELRTSMKAGVAVYPADGQDADTLFRNAEAALKRAKASGERYLFYASEMNAKATELLALETRLRQAVDSGQFVLHYQPKFELAKGRVCGLEALIRWQDPERGLVAPGSFIPLLEETGLILEVGRWAIMQALADYRKWAAGGAAAPRIAVNVSAIQLQQKDFVDTVINAVQQAGDIAEALELEVTESLMMRSVESNIRGLSVLRGMGIHITMDDFGTGYSSLSYVARLPLDKVKIDRSFIAGMAGGEQEVSIVSTIINLAHSLNLRVVAEGVETQEQSDLLKLLHCDEAQGYLFSRPLPADQIGPLLATGGPASTRPRAKAQRKSRRC